MCVALKAAHRAGFQTILDSLRKTSTGTLDARDAKDIEEAIMSGIDAALINPQNVRGTRGHISAAGVTVSLVTLMPNIDIDISIRPLGYPDDITMRLRYSNEV
jgi:hypothetical protein